MTVSTTTAVKHIKNKNHRELFLLWLSNHWLPAPQEIFQSITKLPKLLATIEM